MTQARQETQNAPTIQVGFEKALTMMNPEWRTSLTPEQVNQYRHFYHQGVQDINLLNQLSYQNQQQNFQAVLQTVITTGNEERIAELHREAEAAKLEVAGKAEAPKSSAKKRKSSKTRV